MEYLIRIVTAGNVDDGKSTLIGRLLYEHDVIKDDHWDDLGMKAEEIADNPRSLAQLTDGLKSERDLGITMDIAHRYFTIHNQHYILIDAPGHIEYTPKYFAACTQADILIILIDINKNIEEQSWRHIQIASLLNISKVIFALNKIDICEDFTAAFALRKQEIFEVIESFPLNDYTFIPISALTGENILKSSSNPLWKVQEYLWQAISSFSVPESNIEHDFLQIQFGLKDENNTTIYYSKANHSFMNWTSEWTILNESNSICYLDLIQKKHAHFTFSSASGLDLDRGDILVKSVEDFQEYYKDKTKVRMILFDDFEEDIDEMNILLNHKTYRVNIENVHIIYPKKEEDNISLSALDLIESDFIFEEKTLLIPYFQNKIWGNFILIHPKTKQTIGAGIVI